MSRGCPTNTRHMPPKPPARRFLSGLTCFGSSAMVSLRQSTWRLPAVLVLLRCPSYTTGSADLSPTLGRAGPWAGRKEGPVGPARLPPEVYFRRSPPPLVGGASLMLYGRGLGVSAMDLLLCEAFLDFLPLWSSVVQCICALHRGRTHPFMGQPATHLRC